MDDPLPGLCLASSEFPWGPSTWLLAAALFSMVFSYLYFILNNYSRNRLEQLANGQKNLRTRVDRFHDSLPRVVNAVVAIEIVAKCVFVLCTYITVASFYGQESPNGSATYIVTLLVSSLWFILFCRILPAELGSRREEEAIIRLIPVLRGLGIILYPFHPLLSPFRRTVVGMMKPSDPREEAEQIAEEIIDVVGEGEREGFIREDEADMIENIVELRDVDVAEIMTPRTDMHAVEVSTPVKEAVRLAMDAGHSRIPVFEENIDKVLGIFYVKEVLSHWLNNSLDDLVLTGILRKPLLVPETKKVSELLMEFREQKMQIAIVLDEYGGTAGLVSHEDILEEIVGEIVDEYDQDEEMELKIIDENTLDVSARFHIDDLNNEIGTNIPESNDYDTIGGYIFSVLGKVPEQGDSVREGNAKLTVTDVNERSINRVRIQISREE